MFAPSQVPNLLKEEPAEIQHTGIAMPVRPRRVSDATAKAGGHKSKVGKESTIHKKKNTVKGSKSQPAKGSKATSLASAIATQTSRQSTSPLSDIPPSSPPEPRKATNDYKMCINGDGADIPDCKHDCRHEPVPKHMLPRGIVIECKKCLANFNERADLLLMLVQKTFVEMDMERTESATGQSGITSAAAFRVGGDVLPISAYATKQKNGNSSNTILPLSQSAPVTATADTRPLVMGGREVAAQPQLSIPGAGIAAVHEMATPTNQSDGTSVRESIHVRSTGCGNTTTNISSSSRPVVSALDVSRVNSDSSDGDAQSVMDESFAMSPTATEPPSPLQALGGRKRKLSDRNTAPGEISKRSEASEGPEDEPAPSAVTASRESSPSAFRAFGLSVAQQSSRNSSIVSSSHETIADDEAEDGPTPKRRSIDINARDTSQSLTSSRARSPLALSELLNAAVAPHQPATVAASVLSDPVAHHAPPAFPFKPATSLLPPTFPLTPAPSVAAAKAPAVPIPRSVTSDQLSQPAIVKRPRGRPRKQRPDILQAAPIAIKPKPNTPRAPPPPPPNPTTTFVVDPSGVPVSHTGPIAPRRRGRPPKAKITLNPSPVIIPPGSNHVLPDLATSTSSLPGLSQHPISSPIQNQGGSPAGDHSTASPIPPHNFYQSGVGQGTGGHTQNNSTPSSLGTLLPTAEDKQTKGGWTAINKTAAQSIHAATAPSTPAPTSSSAHKASSVPTTPANGVVKKPRGRPRSPATAVDIFVLGQGTPAAVASRDLSIEGGKIEGGKVEGVKVEGGDPPVKRRPGRPRIYPVKEDPPVKRRPGRPRIYPLKEKPPATSRTSGEISTEGGKAEGGKAEGVKIEGGDPSVKRGPGRPRIYPFKEKLPTTRGRGRPKKLAGSSSGEISIEGGKVEGIKIEGGDPPVKRGPGRPRIYPFKEKPPATSRRGSPVESLEINLREAGINPAIDKDTENGLNLIMEPGTLQRSLEVIENHADLKSAGFENTKLNEEAGEPKAAASSGVIENGADATSAEQETREVYKEGEVLESTDLLEFYLTWHKNRSREKNTSRENQDTSSMIEGE
ncbi:hypothetical protein DFH27DRAFT_224078 [Peziza echinospora]|nr:hypothetical protein DFH27DRAFT_224078 [Peziza echinospora]